MPDTRKSYDAAFWVDLNGTRHHVKHQNFSYSRAGHRRWCRQCGRLTPTNLEAWKQASRCEACYKLLRPTFEQFLITEIGDPMDSSFPVQPPPVPATSTAMGEAFKELQHVR